MGCFFVFFFVFLFGEQFCLFLILVFPQKGGLCLDKSTHQATARNKHDMSSRFAVDGQKAEDRDEELHADIERNAGKKSGSETRPRSASNGSTGIWMFILGVLLGCALVYVGSASKKSVAVVPKHLKNVHQRFRASREAWRNWEEEGVVDALSIAPQGVEAETLQREEKINSNGMDGVEFPKIVWQGWRNADTSKFDNYRVKMIEDNKEWQFNLVTNEEQEKFLRETDDEIVQLAYKSFKLLNPRNGAGRADVWRYAVLYYHGGMYLDIDSSCPDFNRLVSIANEHNANVLLTREGNPSKYIANRKATVMWGFLSKPKHPLFKNVIKMVWDNMSFDQPREEIIARGHQMKEFTIQFTGTIAFSRAVDMTRIMGQGDDIYMHGIDFEGACHWKAPGLQNYYEPGESYESLDNQFYRSKLPDDV